MPEAAGGKPAKGRDQIRSALDSIRQAEVPGHKAGPLEGGLAADARLAIASFGQPADARDFQRVLLESGLMSQVIRRRRRTQVAVDLADRQRAVELLDAYRAQHPEATPTRKHLRYDLAILGGLVGSGIGLAVVIGSGFATFTALALCAWIAIGALTGLLIETSREISGGKGAVLWSVRSLLIVVTLVALFMYVMKVFKLMGLH